MPRYRLWIEYDGSPFAGWQRQGDLPSVQGSLERAALALCGQFCEVIGAGRTDSGVHGLGQCAHLDLPKGLAPSKLRDALNAYLRPDPVAVLTAEAVAPDFHARFSALARHYRYRIINRRPPLTLEKNRAWRLARPLDIAAMREAAADLRGRHDFSTFRDSRCQADSPIRTLDRVEIVARAEEIHLEFSARSFLHRQVRSMVGSLAEVGLGRWPQSALREALLARDRARCGQIAPACGLYLVGVDYPGLSTRDNAG